MEQLKVVIAKTFESEERKKELEKYLVPVRFSVFTAELSSGSSAGLFLSLQGAVARAGTTSSSYCRLRDILMTEVVLNGGANRGEILRKMTLSVSVCRNVS